MYTLDVAPPRIPVAMKDWKHHLAFKELDLIIPFPFMARGRQNQLPMKLQPTKLVKKLKFWASEGEVTRNPFKETNPINPAKTQKTNRRNGDSWRTSCKCFLGAPNVFVFRRRQEK